MKKILILMIITLTMIVNVSKAQDKAWNNFLSETAWRLQNPVFINVDATLLLFKNGNFIYKEINMLNYQSSTSSGTYSIYNGKLILKNQHQELSFSLGYISQNKITLSGSSSTWHYSRYGTADDTWFERYLIASYNPDGIYNPGKIAPQTNNKSYELCYTCRGLGRCIICKGMKKTSNPYTGTRSDCSACDATGKCWGCNGSGKR
jgi:hypothetical protein